MPDALTQAQRTDRFDLRALYESSRLLSASLELEFVLNNLLLTAMSKLLVTRGVVLVYDAVERAYRVKVAKGMPGVDKQARFEVEPPPAETILQGDDVPAVLREHRVELVLPITSPTRDIGLIGLAGKATGQAYESRELEFIASLVNMSSAAVHNSLMVEELKQANRDLDAKIQELNTLFDLSQEFNATIDRERLAKLVSFALMGQMLVAKHLFLVRRDIGREDAAGDVPIRYETVAAKGVADLDLEPELVRSLCGLTELVLLSQTPPTDDGDPWAGLRRRGLELILPIRHQGDTCGILCLGPKMTGQPYQVDDTEFLYAFGNLAFVSIQNSYLVDEQIEKERLQEEMRLARDIQVRLLPQEVPSLDGTQVASLALPSREVGGDYFDVIPLDEDRLLLAIADVTGKGVPASLLMANIQACLQILVPMDLTIEEAVAHINRVICANTSYDKFITFFTGIYHRATGQFEYVNAGHNPPMLIRENGELELLETGGLLLGVLKLPYERGRVTLDPQDVLALFTDGVTEAMSPADEEYGEDRLEALLRRHRSADAQAILDAVRADIRAFTGDPDTLSDDLTMIMFKIVERGTKDEG